MGRDMEITTRPDLAPRLSVTHTHTLVPTRLLIPMRVKQTYYTITAQTTVFLKMNPRVRNMEKTSKIKN